VLKVGKAGPQQHRSLPVPALQPAFSAKYVGCDARRGAHLWPYLGIKVLDEASAGAWIRENTDRDNFSLDSADAALLGDLERYLRARLGPVVEGG